HWMSWAVKLLQKHNIATAQINDLIATSFSTSYTDAPEWSVYADPAGFVDLQNLLCISIKPSAVSRRPSTVYSPSDSEESPYPLIGGEDVSRIKSQSMGILR